MSVGTFATHDQLPPAEQVPGMPWEYVYAADYRSLEADHRKQVTELEHQIAVLQRVIARQDAMLVAGENFDG